MILDKSEKYIIQFDKNNELQALAFAESLGVMWNSMNKPTDWLPSSSKLFSNGNLYLLIEWSDVYIPLPPPEFSIGTQGHYGYSRPKHTKKLCEYYLFIDYNEDGNGFLSYCEMKEIVLNECKGYREINILSILRDEKLNRVLC